MGRELTQRRIRDELDRGRPGAARHCCCPAARFAHCSSSPKPQWNSPRTPSPAAASTATSRRWASCRPRYRRGSSARRAATRRSWPRRDRRPNSSRGADAGLPEGFLGGMREGVGGTLNPGELCPRPAQRRLGLGDTGIRAHARPGRHRHAAAQVTIETANGRVHAKQALLTANAYSKGLSITPRRLVSPVWTSLVETEPIAPERLDAIGWTSRAPDGHRTHDPGELPGHPAKHDRVRHPPPADHERIATRAYPRRLPSSTTSFADSASASRACATSSRSKAWGGWIGMSSTWLPVAGEASPNVLVFVGLQRPRLRPGPVRRPSARRTNSPANRCTRTWRRSGTAGTFWPSFVSRSRAELGLVRRPRLRPAWQPLTIAGASHHPGR